MGHKTSPFRAAGLAENVKPGWIRWVNNERILIELSQFELFYGTPVSSSFLYTLDSKSMRGKILIEPDGFSRQDNAHVISFLDDDPDNILMLFADEPRQPEAIQRINVETGKFRRIKRGADGIQNWYTDEADELRLGRGRSNASGTVEKWNLRIRDADTDTWRTEADYPGIDGETPIFGFTEDPNELLIGDYADRQTLGVYVYDLRKRAIGREVYHHNDFDVSSILKTSGGQVLGAKYVADEVETVMLDERNDLLAQMEAKMPGYQMRQVDRSDDGARILFTVQNSQEPGALLMADSSGQILRLANTRSQLPSNSMGTVVPVKFQARDDFEIPAYITLPPTIASIDEVKKAPFIILPHGGPYARSYQRFDYFAQFFATRGYVVLQMNFRGSAGYGKAFEDAGRKNWVLMLEDIEDGARWALDSGLADPERTCIAGWSFGGYAALMGAINNADMFACAISVAGVTDLTGMVANLGRYRFGRQLSRKYILSGFEGRHAVKANSPVERAGELTVPLFIAHADEDLNVPYSQYTRMRRALGESSATVEYMEFKHDDHGFSKQINRQALLRGIDEFLRTTMGVSEFEQ